MMDNSCDHTSLYDLVMEEGIESNSQQAKEDEGN